MSSMTAETGVVVGGVDTHSQTHHAAVIDHVGRELGDREFPATAAGYGALVVWLRGFGELSRVGVEGTSSYGAGLTRHLRQAGVSVLEVDRPDRRARRAQGKSDPIDAYAAARAALSGRAVGLRQVDGMALAGPGSAGRFRPSGRPGREVALAQFAGRARARAVRLACFARPGKPFSVVTAHTFGVVSKPRRTLTNARSVSSTAMSPR